MLSKIIRLFNQCTFHATNSLEQKDIKNIFGKNTTITIAQNLPERKQIPLQIKQKEIPKKELINNDDNMFVEEQKKEPKKFESLRNLI